MEQRSLKSAAVQGPETNFRLSFSSRLCPSQFHVGKALLVFCGLQVNWAKASLAPIRRVDREKPQFERKGRGAKLPKVRLSENELQGDFKNSSQ